MDLLRPVACAGLERCDQLFRHHSGQRLCPLEMGEEDGQLTVREWLFMREHMEAAFGDGRQLARYCARVNGRKLDDTEVVEKRLAGTRRFLFQPCKDEIRVRSRLVFFAEGNNTLPGRQIRV